MRQDSGGKAELPLMVAASAALCVNFFTAWTVPLQIEEMTTRYGFSVSDAGLAATVQQVVLCATMVFAAPFMAKIRSERLAYCGVFLAVLGFMIVSCAKGRLGMFYVSFGIAGIGQGLAGVGGNGLAAAAGNPGRVYNVGYGAGILFGAASLLLVPFVPSPFANVSPMFFACSLGMGVCLVALSLARPDTGKSLHAVAPRELPRLGYSAVAPLSSVFLLFLCGSGVWSYSELLGHRIGIGERVTSTVLSTAAAASIIAPLLVARLGTKPNLSVAIAISFAANAAGFLIACTTHNAPVFLSSFFGQAIGQAAVAGLIFIIGVRADPTGRLSSLGQSCNLFGSATGPFAAGLLVSTSVPLLAAASTTLCVIGWVALAWFERRVRQGTWIK
jgi:hypothetical protein